MDLINKLLDKTRAKIDTYIWAFFILALSYFVGKNLAVSLYNQSINLNLIILFAVIAVISFIMLGLEKSLLVWLFLGIAAPIPLKSLPGTSQDLYLFHIFIGALGLIYIIESFIKGKIKLNLWKTDSYLSLFMLFTFLSFLFGFFLQEEISKHSFAIGLMGLSIIFIAFAAYYVVSLNIDKKQMVKYAVIALVFAALLNLTMVMYFGSKYEIPEETRVMAGVNLEGYMAYDALHKASPAYMLSMGFAIQLIFLMLLPIVFVKKLDFRLRILLIFIEAFLFYRLFPPPLFQWGRTGVFAMLAGILGIASFNKNRFKIFAVLFIFLVVLVTLNYDAFMIKFNLLDFNSAGRSSMTRFGLWMDGLRAFTSNPVFGVGPGGFGRYSTTLQLGLVLRKASEEMSTITSLHNSWLQVLVEEGIIGFALIGLFFYNLLRKCVFYIKSNKVGVYRALAIGMYGSIISAFIYSLGGTYIFPSATGGGFDQLKESIYFWIILGILSALLKIKNEDAMVSDPEKSDNP